MFVTPEVDKEPTIEVRITYREDRLLVHPLATHPSSSSRYLTPLSYICLLKSDHLNVPACTRMAPSS